jgi:phage tail sheath gpL-like
MPDTIAPFSEIPPGWLVPSTLVEVRPQPTNTTLATWPARALVIGQQIGTQNYNVPFAITRKEDAATIFGAGSQAALMAVAFLTANPYTPLTVLGLPDPTGGVKASGTVTVSSLPTQASTLPMWIGGTPVSILVSPTDTTASIATRFAAAINAIPSMPVIATSALAVVTLTAKNAGVVGNGIPIYFPWWTVPFAGAYAYTQLSGGSGDIDVTATIAAIASDWYTDVAVPSTSSTVLAALIAEAESRYTAGVARDMHLYAGFSGTYTAQTTLSAAYNAKTLTLIGFNSSPTPPWIWAATLCGVASQQLANDPARQLRGLVLPGVMPPIPTLRWLDTERQGLLTAGISTWTATPDGNVALERIITTRRNTDTGAADASWLDIMVPATLSRIRYDWRQYVRTAYPRAKLARDGSIAAETDASVVTPQAMANAWAARCKLYARYGWIQNEAVTIPQAAFQIDLTDPNRLNGKLVVQVMGSLMVFAAALEFSR